jgi:hypothetical protein
MLNDGEPQLRYLIKGGSETYLVYVPSGEMRDGHVGLTLRASFISGSVSLYASANGIPTNASFTWQSQARIDGARPEIPGRTLTLAACEGESFCPFRVTAESLGGATFTILALLDRPDSGVIIAISTLIPQPARLLWSEAEAACSATVGGHLASIQSEADNDRFLVQCRAAMATPAAGEADGCWLGLTETHNESVWRWTDEDPLRYTHWAPGEPNGHPVGGTDAVYMHTGDYPTGTWDDTWGEREAQRRPTVCRTLDSRPYFFGSATFGPSLPLVPLSLPVAATVPPDACSPLEGDAAAAVAGRAALATRGGCDFTVKVRNVQQAGGRAMLLTNNEVRNAPARNTLAGVMEPCWHGSWGHPSRDHKTTPEARHHPTLASRHECHVSHPTHAPTHRR